MPDVRDHRAHVVKRLVEMEKAGRPEKELWRAHNKWTPDRVGQFARTLGQALLDDFGQAASTEEIKAWVNVALDRELGLSASTGSAVRDWEIERLKDERWPSAGDSVRDEAEVALYADSIRATRLQGDQRVMTPIGRLVHELPDNDAHRWLLAAEAVQSDGVEDQRRLCRESAAFLLKNPEDYWDINDGIPSWPIDWGVLVLLSKRGLVEATDSDVDIYSYKLLPRGHSLLRETASGRETPFTLLIRALLQDETSAMIERFGGSEARSVRESSADATARHARMVAHEIRNALVPVQSAVESLYRDLDREGKSSIAEKRRSGIDGGIDRIFRFLQDISSIADLASTPSDLFDLTGPVNEAIVAITSDTGLTIPFDSPGALPAVKGHRDRFSLALVNVLRNAVQSRPREGLQIRVSAGTHNGAEVYVAVDDNGPGVPAEHRSTIFEPGFSLRAQGSGQGLALVREVIEAEMAGRAVCEQSDLGGARIVLRLPVGSKRKL